MGKKPRVPTDAGDTLTNNPFGALAGALDDVPEGTPPAESAPAAAEDAPNTSHHYQGKVVVRREKKGRGGKTATVIEGLTAEEDALEDIARRLRKELGCGTHVEGASVVVGGAQVDRVCNWLRRDGARRVVAGN